MAEKEQSAIYQILKRHLAHGRLRPGEEIGVRADQLMFQDGTGTMIYLHLNKLNKARSQKFAVCYVDHNTLGDGPENSDDHLFLQTASARHRVVFSKAGNGIGHQLHLERYAVPGQLLLGADSHVTTMGGLGMLAIGTGGLELAVAMTGAPHYFVCPAVTRVILDGKLNPFCSAKDVILTLIGQLAARNNVGCALEYAGRGVETLSVAQRATITNMGAELGVTTSLFPADKVTRAYLTSQRRGGQYKAVNASVRAEVADEIRLDLGAVVPMVSLPNSPLRVVPVREAAGVGVQQVAIGSCTNGFFEDLAAVAAMLDGRKVHPSTSLVVSPGTRQVLHALMDTGALKGLLLAGARLVESACGFCIGNGQVPGTKWVSVRTSNRNYEGRCGAPDALVYLASAETAAATALRGQLTDPRDLRLSALRLKAPKALQQDDGLMLVPPKKGRVEVIGGAHIVEPPATSALPPSLWGVASLKVGDHVSTDHILPGGRLLKYRSNIQEYARYTFAGIDPDFVRRAEQNRDQGVFNIIVAGDNYGEGSSREHAAMCPMLLGVRVVVAKSFERIHVANLINFGIVPLSFIDPKGYDQIHEGDDLELPWIGAELKRSEIITVRSPDKGYELKLKHGLSRRQIEILLSGGLRNYVR